MRKIFMQFASLLTSGSRGRYIMVKRVSLGILFNSVRRYSFDAQHKRLSTTQKEYCVDPPASAYR